MFKMIDPLRVTCYIVFSSTTPLFGLFSVDYCGVQPYDVFWVFSLLSLLYLGNVLFRQLCCRLFLSHVQYTSTVTHGC